MHRDHSIFIQAIKDRKKVCVEYCDDGSPEVRTRVCRPLFYIPANSEDSSSHYYLWNSVSGKKGDVFWLTPEQIVRVESTREPFDPTGFALAGDEVPSARSTGSSDSSREAS